MHGLGKLLYGVALGDEMAEIHLPGVYRLGNEAEVLVGVHVVGLEVQLMLLVHAVGEAYAVLHEGVLDELAAPAADLSRLIPYFYQGAYKNDTWCLGSQYWGRVPHVDGYNARYGILLDMVGGKNATFYKEQFSQRTAGKYVNKIWNTAHRLGFGNFFPKEKGTEVTDDHMYVYNLRQIPCVDIINYDPNCDTGFGDFWHTIDDTMDIIDKGTLNAVGQTLLEVIYNEK